MLTQSSPPEPIEFEAADSSLVKQATVMVAMRDGVRLATEIFVPTTVAVNGTIVERTPYGRKPPFSSSAIKDSYYRYIEHLCLNGYSVLMQDCRGTGDSEGAFVKYTSEADDGVDTIAWAANQEWTGGGFFLTGRSYSAHAALALIVNGASHIRGIFMDCGGFWSAYHESARQGGAFELKQAMWAFDAARRNALESGNGPVLRALESQNLSDWMNPTAPWQHRQSPLRFAPDVESSLLELWDHDQYDDYWQQPSLSARGRSNEMAAFPSLHISGWYDLYITSTVRLFEEMGSRAGADAYLIIGPWTHCALDDTVAGDADFGDEATIRGATGTDYLGARTQWVNYAAGRVDDFGPRVRFFVMGGGGGNRVRGRINHGGSWLQSESWPPRNTGETTYWLGAQGNLDKSPLTEETRISYRYDPTHPVPTIGGAVGSYTGLLQPGAFDQKEDVRFFGSTKPYLPLTARPDVLSFTTDALTEDLIVVGEATLTLDFSTTGEDTDITVKLVDVYPPSEQHPEGFAMNVCDTIARLRSVDKHETIARSGETTHRLTITLPPTANRFTFGHQIRVDISSSNFPRFDVNGNRASRPRSRDHQVVTNSVTSGGIHGARILLPTLNSDQAAGLEYSTAAVSPPGSGLVAIYSSRELADD